MKYFTRDWYNTMDDDTFEVAFTAYDVHVRRLPATVATLAGELSLHDALIESVVWRVHARVLQIRFLCGDLQKGYEAATFAYRGVVAVKPRMATFSRIANNPRTEVLYDEFDTIDTFVEHRCLLWPSGELSIRCATISLCGTPRRNRTLDAAMPFYA